MKSNQVRVIMRTIVIEEPLHWKYSKPKTPDGSFVGMCEQLGITAEGESKEALEAAARDAIDLLIESLIKHDDVTEYLTKRKVAFRIEDKVMDEFATAKDNNDSFTLMPRSIPQLIPTQHRVAAAL